VDTRGARPENPPADSATYIGKNDQASYRRCGDALFGYWLEQQIGKDFDVVQSAVGASLVRMAGEAVLTFAFADIPIPERPKVYLTKS
jgi:hypothetical protein